LRSWPRCLTLLFVIMTDTRSKSRAGDKSDNLTPAMRQYFDQKKSAPEALLLFRMGDFYETFYEDAEVASRVLGIALTSRGKDKGGATIPLAGIPYHALDSYLTKLVRAGRSPSANRSRTPSRPRG